MGWDSLPVASFLDTTATTTQAATITLAGTAAAKFVGVCNRGLFIDTFVADVVLAGVRVWQLAVTTGVNATVAVAAVAVIFTFLFVPFTVTDFMMIGHPGMEHIFLFFPPAVTLRFFIALSNPVVVFAIVPAVEQVTESDNFNRNVVITRFAGRFATGVAGLAVASLVIFHRSGMFPTMGDWISLHGVLYLVIVIARCLWSVGCLPDDRTGWPAISIADPNDSCFLGKCGTLQQTEESTEQGG